MSYASLPLLNASLNAVSALLLTYGWWQIHNRRIEAHRRTMIAAFISSSLFLTSYLIYHAKIGSKPFPGTGVMRMVYFSILIPHVMLAVVVLPLSIITLVRGLKRQDAKHHAIAKWTLPLWWFVSVTGVVVYVMLYRMY
jgi:putative membrane protein